MRNHPGGLTITAPSKMRNGQKVLLSFRHTIQETVVFDIASDSVSRNFQATERLLDSLGLPQGVSKRSSGENLVWTDVPAGHVIDFLGEYHTSAYARTARSELLRQYISDRFADGELTEWTIALIDNASAAHKFEVGDFVVGLTGRAPLDSALSGGRYAIRRLVSPRDELIDLTREERDSALQRTIDWWKINPGRSRRTSEPDAPSGPAARSVRPPSRGLLLVYPLDPDFETETPRAAIPIVGIAVSFPESPKADATVVEYTVNNVYLQRELEME